MLAPAKNISKETSEEPALECTFSQLHVPLLWIEAVLHLFSLSAPAQAVIIDEKDTVEKNGEAPPFCFYHFLLLSFHFISPFFRIRNANLIMAVMLKGDWVEALDPGSGSMYYFNKRFDFLSFLMSCPADVTLFYTFLSVLSLCLVAVFSIFRH
jgi:hypothetical protein